MKTTKSRRPVTTGTLERDKRPEDFIQPSDPVNERKTGYNKGHIRSLLELDTYGPNQSIDVNAKRSDGSLPSSPNTDRFSTGSPTGSRASTRSRNTMQGSRASRQSSSKRKGNMFDQLQGKPDPVATLPEVYGVYTSTINPRSKGRTWFHEYKSGKRDAKNRQEETKAYTDYRRQMEREADTTSNHLDEFEARLRTIKRF